MAPIDFVFKWWTDLSEKDSKYVKPLKSRDIIEKKENIIIVEDGVKILGRKMKYKVRVTLNPPYEWLAEYEGSVAKAISRYKISEVGEGTRLDYESHIEPRGWFTRLFSPIISRFLIRVFSTEMDAYCRALEDEFSMRR